MGTTSQPHPAPPTRAIPHRGRFRKDKAAGFRADNNRAPRNDRRDYERYLALAHAESLRGDPIAAENYFQHAEHYLRSMRGDPT